MYGFVYYSRKTKRQIDNYGAWVPYAFRLPIQRSCAMPMQGYCTDPIDHKSVHWWITTYDGTNLFTFQVGNWHKYGNITAQKNMRLSS